MVEMAISIELILIGVLVVALAVISVYLFVRNREWKIKFEQRVKDYLEEYEETVRKDAISRSARTLSGKALEKLIPFLDRFGHDPHDVRWIGDPIDLIVFDGYSDSGRTKIDNVTFVEVKSGESTLHTGQKNIRETIEKKKVKWEEFRI